MVCNPCGNAQHGKCVDTVRGTLYRGCTCQHKERKS